MTHSTQLSGRRSCRRSAVVLTCLALLPLLAVGGWYGRRWLKTRVPQTRIAERATYDGPPAGRPPAEDWPRWLGPRGDNTSHETGLADAWPEGGPPRLWSAEVGLGFSSPVAAAGRVYVFSHNNGKEALTAFEADTGRIVWNNEAAGAWSGPHPGTRATPWVEGDRVYTFGGAGDLICRDIAGGQPVWRTNVLAETGSANLRNGTASNPLVDGDLIYVQAGDGGPTAVAVDRGSGAIVWRSQARTVAGYAHPILADVAGSRQLIVLAGDHVYGMDPGDGRTIWSYPFENEQQISAAAPVYDDGHLFVTSGFGGGSLVLRLSPGGGVEKVWSSGRVQGLFQPVVLDAGSLYVNNRGTVECLGFPDGVTRWRGDDPTVRLGDGGSLLRIRDGDRLLTMSDRGVLSLAWVSSSGLTLLAQTEAFDGGNIYASPLLYGGRLYAKGVAELVCFDLSFGTAIETPEPQ